LLSPFLGGIFEEFWIRYECTGQFRRSSWYSLKFIFVFWGFNLYSFRVTEASLGFLFFCLARALIYLRFLSLISSIITLAFKIFLALEGDRPTSRSAK